MYVGMGAGAKGLKQRIRQLVDFGFGKPVGYRGGRMLWHFSEKSGKGIEFISPPTVLHGQKLAKFKDSEGAHCSLSG